MNFKRFSTSDNQWHDIPYYQHKTATDTLTLPAVIYPNDTSITVGIKGQSSQASTPTPQNPVDVNGTGERTANLWNEEGFSARAITSTHEHTDTNTYGTTLSTTIGKEVIITQSEYPTGTVGYQNGFFFIDVDFSKYEIGDKVTFSFDYICNEVHSIEGQISTTLYAGKNSNSIPVVLSSGKWSVSGRLTAVITIIADMSPYVEVRLCGNSITVKNIMLNSGSTALPYEPYGFEIPISSGGVNLFDKNKRTDNSRVVYTTGEIGALNGVFVSDFTQIEPNTAYTLNVVSSISGKTGHLFALYDENKNFVNTGTHEATSATVYTFTTPSNVVYIRFNGNMSSVDSIMLNRGSAPLPYEPYNRTTTPIYLGEVPTTRKIGKLVLTGNENWVSKGNPATFRYENSPILDDLNSVCYCSHFKNLPWAQVGTTNNSFVVWFTSAENTINIRCEDYSTVKDFKAFLSAQYQNGTPVTVWYVLATPTTGIVNEPIRKIGDYADTVSGITIPTIAGADSFDVLTTLKPSEVTVNYKGWHPIQNVHEAENGQWD